MGVRRLAIFGSAARDEMTDDSDLDFLVEFSKISFDAYFDVKFYLEKLFGCTVDLVMADTVKPRLKPYIEKEAVYAKGL